MACWLLLATLVLGSPGGFGSSTEGALGWPRVTECRSPQLETFTCYWTYGDLHNLSTSITLQYKTRLQPWMDCPDPVSAGANSCYFNEEHTSLLWNYHIRLFSENVTYDTRSFFVDDIMEPGPPRNLSWTALEGGAKHLLMDIQITWKPPTVGQLMALEYEVQIKEAKQTHWKTYDVQEDTQLLIYDLKMGKEYLVKVRCRQRGNEKFGEFSDVLSIQKLADSPALPSITECRSPQQETFTCYWTHGDSYNHTGLLKLQYIKPGLNWTDCPDTVSAGDNACYFSKNYTSIWVGYHIRLISDNVTFHEVSFTVDEIVRPDPPMALNWTSLNISETQLHMDVLLTWEPPATADVKSGWISLEYEVQIKEANKSQWKTYDIVSTTSLSIYGLKIGKEYWVKIRCRQRGNPKFGEFSEVLVIQDFATINLDFPWPLFLIIGLFTALLLAFIIFCKKKRLKMLILPPVPVPKIKGIDPALLQEGKLDEVSSILASHETYKQQLCIDDPWVEFIELDLDEHDEKNEGADTDRLLGEEYPNAHICLAVKDDDSGRASCCEPDMPENNFSNSDTCDECSASGQPQNTRDNQADLMCLNEKSISGETTDSQKPNTEKSNKNPEDAKLSPLLVNGTTNVPASSQLNSTGSKPSIDFYALVSDITPAGRILLSPGQRMKMENEECSEPATTQCPTNLNMDNSYICESAVMPFCPVGFPTEVLQNSPQNPNLGTYFTPESLIAMSSHSSEKAPGCEVPVADYTSVHIINSPQNLVLNTTAPPGKEFLTPCGYMSTDQMNKVMP